LFCEHYGYPMESSGNTNSTSPVSSWPPPSSMSTDGYENSWGCRALLLPPQKR
jgi:hypothetical protein